jgi:hypothetical protein
MRRSYEATSDKYVYVWKTDKAWAASGDPRLPRTLT